MINLDEFWQKTPNAVIQGIAIALVCIGIGGGVAIGKSSNVKVNKQGIAIERQAIKNQSGLENSLTIIEIQRVRLGQLEDKVQKLRKKKQVPSDLVEEVENVQEIIPQSKVEKLKSTVEESRAVLSGEDTRELHQNSEDY